MSTIKITLLVAAILTTSSPARAADAWSKQDVALLATYATVHAMDWGQTLYVTRHPDQFKETNPMFGSGHPSEGRVNTVMAAQLAIIAAATHYMPAKHRPWFQCITIGLRSAIVGWNYSIGVKTTF